MNYRNLLTLCLGLVTLAVPPAKAGPDLQISGLLTMVGGKVLNGSLQGPMPDNPDVHCPCYVADWANFGTYDGAFSFSAESRVGLQAVASLTDRLSLTAQVTARPTQPQAELQWAYASYILSPNWDLQIGRKRIPLYFYSDFQDVGVSYPWVGLPPEIYGWEATNYNGVSLRHRVSVGEVYVNTSVFAGNEQVKDSRYWLSYGQRHTDVTWQNILGADVELTKAGWTVRAVAMQGSTAFTDKDNPTNDASEDLKAYGLAVNADWNRWFVLSEIATNIRYNKTGPLAGLTLSVPAASVGIGYRSGPWTTFADNPSPGNIRDGLITDAMKSAGAARKGGSSPIVSVLDYGEVATQPGLSLLCAPGNDVESVTALVAAGANVVLFTTGLGTPTGNPIAPVVKVSSNTDVATRLSELIDFDCGSILEGADPEGLADALLAQIVATASGQTQTQADRLGQHDFIFWRRDISL